MEVPIHELVPGENEGSGVCDNSFDTSDRDIKMEQAYSTEDCTEADDASVHEEEFRGFDESQEQTGKLISKLEIYDDFSCRNFDSPYKQEPALTKNEHQTLKRRESKEREEESELYENKPAMNEEETLTNPQVKENSRIPLKSEEKTDESFQNNKETEEEEEEDVRMEENTGIEFVEVDEPTGTLQDFTSGTNPSETSEDLTCPLCFKTFARVRNLNRHLENHPRQEGLKCSICCKYFGNKKLMDEHAAGRKYGCPVCDKEYCYKSSYYWHRDTHKVGYSGEKRRKKAKKRRAKERRDKMKREKTKRKKNRKEEKRQKKKRKVLKNEG